MAKFYWIFLRSLYTLLYIEIIKLGLQHHYFSYCYPLPVTDAFSGIVLGVSFSDFGLQFLVVIILHSLTSYLKGCRFSGKVYTILISFTSYLKYTLLPLTGNNSVGGILICAWMCLKSSDHRFEGDLVDVNRECRRDLRSLLSLAKKIP